MVQRRAGKEPNDKGGWRVLFTFLGGTGNMGPAPHLAFRSNSVRVWFGWPSLPKLEAMRLSWFNAPDLAAQQRVARALQEQAMVGVPCVPMGMFEQPTVFRGIAGVPDGFPQFCGVKRG